MTLLTMRNVDSVPWDTFKIKLPRRSARRVREDITEVEVIARPMQLARRAMLASIMIRKALTTVTSANGVLLVAGVT